MKQWIDVEPEAFLALIKEGKLTGDQVIDVREQMEWDYYHLEPSTLMPLNTIPERMDEIPVDKPVYLICAHGIRSVSACRYLHEKGYGNLRNVEGGMAAVALAQGFQYD